MNGSANQTNLSTLQQLSPQDFAVQFGTTVEQIPPVCLQMIGNGHWGYEVLEGTELENIVHIVEQRIAKREFSVVRQGDKSRWQKGWGENLDRFIESGGAFDSLLPRYIRKNLPLRINQNFVISENDDFEKQWYEIFRLWLLNTYFKGFENIFEFGCGSGFTIAALAQMYPESTVTGLDWVQPSVDIVNKMHEIHGLRTRGRLFDFFVPDYSLDIPDQSIVMTGGALEQTGVQFEPFLDFLLKKRPALVVHIEPILEWYDAANRIDYLAIRAHEERNFLRGYINRLHELEKQGKIEILKKHRTHFGSLLMEGYSQVIWRPKADREN